MVNTKINLCGVTLDNPVIPASGTFGFGYEYADIYDRDSLISIRMKKSAIMLKLQYSHSIRFEDWMLTFLLK